MAFTVPYGSTERRPNDWGCCRLHRNTTLVQENGKDRCTQAERELSLGLYLAVPHEAELGIRGDVAFFQAVQSVLAKHTTSDARFEEELAHAVRQIIL